MAWNIGANDVANAMGTSIGSGALTLKKAILIAAVFEFAGAFLVGSHVTETVRKGIIDLSIFTEMENGTNILMYGMLASLLAAGAWLQIASYFGWPVSTTHSIVGAIVGFGIVAGGAASCEDILLAVKHPNVSGIALSSMLHYNLLNKLSDGVQTSGLVGNTEFLKRSQLSTLYSPDQDIRSIKNYLSTERISVRQNV